MAGVELSQEPQLAVPRESDQFRALAEMRWRVFVRSMRNDSAKISFVLWLTGRIMIFVLAIGVGAFCGFFAYLACTDDWLTLPKVFFLVMLGWQGMALLRDQQAGVELELLRFPMRLRTYIALWLSAGALEGLTILGVWASVGLFAGLLFGHANPVRAAVAVGLFLVCNLALARNVVLWMGRLLARRRTRELVLVLFSVLGILPRLMRNMWSHLGEFFHRLPLPPAFFTAVHGLPPALAARTAFGEGSLAAPLAGLLLWDAALVAVLVVGLRRAFRGEHLQEFAAAAEPKRLAARTVAAGAVVAAPASARSTRPAVVVAQMEWARLRHGGAAMYGTLTPLLYVAFIGLRVARSPVGFWTLPMAAAYLALTLRAYNVFGADGPGVQTFLLLPIPLREVVLGKNLYAAAIFTGQVTAATLLVALVAHRISGPALAFTVVWAVCHMAISFSIGNVRSVRQPTPVSTARIAVRGSRGDSGGGWIAMLCVFSASIVGGMLVAAATWWHYPWLAPVAMLPFTVAAVVWYRRSLASPLLQGDVQGMEPLGLVLAKTA